MDSKSTLFTIKLDHNTMNASMKESMHNLPEYSVEKKVSMQNGKNNNQMQLRTTIKENRM